MRPGSSEYDNSISPAYDQGHRRSHEAGGFRRLDSQGGSRLPDHDSGHSGRTHGTSQDKKTFHYTYDIPDELPYQRRHTSSPAAFISAIPLRIRILAITVLILVVTILIIVIRVRGKKSMGADLPADNQTLTEQTSDTASAEGDTTDISGSSSNDVTGEIPDTSDPSEASVADDGPSTAMADGMLSSSISFYDGYETHKGVSSRYISNEKVISDAAVLIDADTGEIIADRNAYASISPASMTKILTVLVAAEHLKESQLDDTFEITRAITDYAYSNDLSAVGFQVGDTPTVRDLFYGTILPSGADAGVALAEYTAGSQEAFVELMNEKLDTLGLSGTAHFTNCVGLYDEDHFCTLTDMAMILKAAVENDMCREVLSAHKYTTSPTQEHPEGIEISNWFLRRIEDKDTHGNVICAKTGFVKESGCCAASYAESNDGHRYFLVTSNAWSSWRCIYDQVEIYSAYLK